MNLIHDPLEIENQLFNIQSERKFLHVALSVFFFQIRNNPVYSEYCRLVGIDSSQVHHLHDIPFLPIEFFKQHQVISGEPEFEMVFVSSGTTGMQRSSHYIRRLDLYRKSFINAFESFYGPTSGYCILALLPGYLEQQHSSLVFMVQELISRSGHPESGFYLYDYDSLARTLRNLDKQGQQVILFGVSHALLDMAEKYGFNLKNTIVMETGGMKGRRKEITRGELHTKLKEGFGVETIHSEYGMAELLSQAYSRDSGNFHTPSWMKVLIRDVYDPFTPTETGQSGGINVIDLANLYSCSFIETRDIGRLNEDGSFGVLGRFDNSDIRGCNLMVME